MVRLEHDVVLLCEGQADQNFLRKLTEKRGGFPEFDTLPPTAEHSGATNFGRMLQALRGDRIGFSRIKRVVIVADSGSDPQTTFDSICLQISGVGGYPVPMRPSNVVVPNNDHPGVAIMLLPDDTSAGALETLCVRALDAKHSGVLECVSDFLQCGTITAHRWSPEKLDKSRYHCIVAACNHDDPSRTVSWAFRSPNPLVDLDDACFNNVVERLRLLFADIDMH